MSWIVSFELQYNYYTNIIEKECNIKEASDANYYTTEELTMVIHCSSKLCRAEQGSHFGNI